MPITNYRSLDIAVDSSTLVNGGGKTRPFNGGSLGTAAIVTDSLAAKVNAVGKTRTSGTKTLAVDSSTLINILAKIRKSATLTLATDSSTVLAINFNHPRHLTTASVAGIPITGQLWPRTNEFSTFS